MDMFKKIYLPILLMFLVNACVTTTALYGNEFEKVSEGVYTLKIFFGGPPPAFTDYQKIINDVDKRLDEEAKKFMLSTNQYSSYKIVDRDQTIITSAFVYTVEFTK